MSIGSNILYDGTNGNNAVTLNITTTRKVDLSAITPNSGSTDFNVKSGQVLTGELHENISGNFMAPDGSYRICIADNATVMLKDVTIHRNAESQMIPWAGLTCLGDATIILEGDNTVNAFYYQCPGILPGPTGTTLTIKGSGSLSAQSIYYEYYSESEGKYKQSIGGAGIGCGSFYNSNFAAYNNTSCGNIRIEGGDIKATGGFYSAGIGTAGSFNAENNTIPTTCGDITITGGTIEAKGGINAAGIGTGCSAAQANVVTSTCGNIIISGGEITATGGFKPDGSHYDEENDAAGIGAGYNGYCQSINIGGSSSGTATSASNDSYSIGGHDSSCPYIYIFGDLAHGLNQFGHSYTWSPSNH